MYAWDRSNLTCILLYFLQRNKVFMVPSLIFWGILLSIWIFYAMFAVGTSEMKGQNEKFILLLVSLAILTSMFVDLQFVLFEISRNNPHCLFHMFCVVSISVLYVGCYLLTVIVCILMKTAKTQCRTSISVFQDPESCTAINETNALKSKYFDM